MRESDLLAAYGVTVHQGRRWRAAPLRPRRPVERIWVDAPVPDPAATWAYLRRQGWHVHRVGSVAYAHDPRAPERAGWLALGVSGLRVGPPVP